MTSFWIHYDELEIIIINNETGFLFKTLCENMVQDPFLMNIFLLFLDSKRQEFSGEKTQQDKPQTKNPNQTQNTPSKTKQKNRKGV